MIKPYTFSFNGVNSSVYGLEYDTLTDKIAPDRRNDRITIDFRHGSFASNSDTREDKVVSFRVTWKTNKPLDRFLLREIAYWLRGSGQLSFDIEPDKYYNARMDRTSELSLARIVDKTDGVLRSGSLMFQFVCEPFAYSAQFDRQLLAGRNEIEYNGTERGHPFIRISNHTDTSMPIPGFRISIHKRIDGAIVPTTFNRAMGYLPSAINLSRCNFMRLNRQDLRLDTGDNIKPPEATELSLVNIKRYNFMRFNVTRSEVEHVNYQTKEQNAVEIDIALDVGEAIELDNKLETITLIKADTTRHNIRHLLSLPHNEYLALDRESTHIDVEQTQAHDVDVKIKISEVWL